MKRFGECVIRPFRTNSVFVKRHSQFDIVPCALFFAAIFMFSGVCNAADGDLDQAFGSGGVKTIQISAQQVDFAKAVAIQADGKIVDGGEDGRYSSNTNRVALVRLNADGS